MGADLQAGKSEGRYRIAAFYQAYAAEKANDEWHGEWGAAMLYRPLAILVSSLLLRLKVPACTVTILSLLATLSLPVVALTAGVLPLALVAMLEAVLDCVDGTIARASGTISRTGQYLDFMADVVFRTTLYAAVGLLAQHALPSGLHALALPLAILAALLAIVARLCRIYAEQLAGAAPYGRQAFSGGIGQRIFSAVSGLDSLLPLAILALGLAGWLGWLILWLLFYSALDFLYTQFAILRRIA